MISEYGIEVLENRINVHSENRDKWDGGIKLIEAATVVRWLNEMKVNSPQITEINEREAWEKISEMYAPASPEELMEILNDYFNIEQPKTAPLPSPKSYLHSCITKELNAIYVAKNSDYGDAFGETYKKLGIISAVTRITDKVNRLQSLATKSDEERMVKDESIVDSAKDLANYAIMLLIEMGYEPLKKNEVMIGNTKATLYAADHLKTDNDIHDHLATERI